MNVLTVILAQSVRRVTARSRLYMPDVIAAIEKRYAFVKTPTTFEEIVPAEGAVTFKHGKLEHRNGMIVIDTLQLHQQLVIAETGISTDDADAVLGDLLSEDMGLMADDPHHPKMYASQLEVQSDMAFRFASGPAAALTMNMAESVKSYFPEQFADHWPAAFELASVAMQPDPTKFVLPCEFRVERRVGHPYSAGVYFSQAPLRTAHHIAALEKFEEAVKAAAATSSSEPPPPGERSPNAS